MKTLLMAAVAAAAILPLTAQAADTASGTINLSASAPNTCSIRGIGAATGTTGLTGTGSNVTLALGTDAVDATTAEAKVVVKDLTLDAFCNYATHNVSLRSQNGGLVNAATTPVVGSFNRRIGYTASVSNWASSSPAANLTATDDLTTATATEDTASSAVTSAVNTSTAAIKITTTASSSAPLLAGDYTDVLTIRLGAAF